MEDSPNCLEAARAAIDALGKRERQRPLDAVRYWGVGDVRRHGRRAVAVLFRPFERQELAVKFREARGRWLLEGTANEMIVMAMLKGEGAGA
jgi:hypothetical protein